jgi:phosphatidylserine/phosphatidylglycerophosphate/cardiolipin synthase-like enzyme
VRLAPFLLALATLAPAVGAGAAGWSLEVRAPALVASGEAFTAGVCASGAASIELRVALLLDGRAASRGGGRFGAPEPPGCRDVVVRSDDVEGNATLSVRARPAGGGAVRAEARAPVRLARVDVPIALDEAWGAPFAGAVLRNAGAAPASLRNLTLGAAPLPDATLAPGERVFVGAKVPPGAPRHVAWNATKDWTLRSGARVLAALPAPPAARVTTLNGTRRQGLTEIHAEPAPVAGAWTVYATPDAGDAPVVGLLDGAQREIDVEAYTLTSRDVAAALGSALDRGVHVRLLLEGAPVGGVPTAEKGILAALASRGAEVDLMRSAPSFPTRYATLHAKLVVVDREAALVSTENLQESSYPPAAGTAPGTRGFGLVVRNASLAQRVAGLMDLDAAPWPDVQPVDLATLPPPVALTRDATARPGPTFTAEGSWNATLVLSPDSSDGVVRLIQNASTRIVAAQLYADAQGDPMLDALVSAARRGVSVRLALDAHVDDGRNAAAVARLTALAAREGLPLEARLDDPARTLHAKVVLVDGRAMYLGSMNWGNASMHANREAGLVVEAPPLVAFVEGVLEKDGEKRGAAPERGSAAPGERKAGGPEGAAVLALVAAAALTCRAWRSRRRGSR